MAAQLIVDIVTDASKAVAGFKKVDSAASGTATKTQSAGSKIATLAKAVATGYAVEKVVEFGKESVNAAEGAVAANARLAAMFAKTGDTTGEAAKHAEEFADSLGKQIGVSPEVIEGAQGILTAFHSVSDETGRSAGLFDGATKAAADLAAAGFGNLTDNSKTLGKALSDPAKGMAILRRSGVVLDAAQQQQIKTMEKQGNLLGAQKALLGDVNQSVGGTAAATATASSKMKVAWEEAQVSIGTKLLPAVQKVQQILAGLINFVSAHTQWIGPIAAGIGVLAAAVLAVAAAQKAYNAVLAIGNAAVKAWQGMVKVATAVQWLWNVAMDANPLVLIVLAIVALIAGIVLLVIKVKVIREAMLEAWHAVSAAAQVAFKAVLAAIHWVWDWLKANWPYILGILLGPFGLAAAAIYKNWSSIKAGAAAVLGWLRAAWSTVYATVTGPFSRALGWIRGAFDSLVGFVEGIPAAIGRAMAGVFNAIIRPFQLAFHWITDNVLGPIKSVWNSVANTINAVHIKTPGVKILGHTVVPSFDWRPPFHIPTLASGGVFNRATLAVVGEAGREVVAPEAMLRSIVGQGQSGDTHITIKVEVPPTANPAAVGRSVVDALRAYVRANGAHTRHRRMSALIPYETGTLELSVQMAIGAGGAGSAWDASTWNHSKWASEIVGGWVDVTCDVSDVNLTAGASQPDGVLTAINSTTGGITLHGDQYNPWAPPWGDQGQLGPRMAVQLLWRHAHPNLMPAQAASLEDGTTTGWLATNNVTLANSTAQAADGAHSLAMTSLGSPGATIYVDLDAPYRAPVQPGVAFAVAASFQAAGQGRACQLFLTYYDATGGQLSAWDLGPVTDTAGQWTTLAATITPPAAAASLGIRVVVAGVANGEVHYLDALSVSLPADPWQVAFTGVTDAWPFERSSGTATVPVIDAVGGLANLSLPTLATPVGQGEALSDRMNRILTAAAWPNGLRQIPADPRKVISTTFGASAWPMLQNAADTGLGLLWVTRQGEVAYLPVGQAGGWAPSFFGINLTDTHADPSNVCVVDYQNSDPQVVRNSVSVARAADPAVSNDTPVPAVMVDQASVAQYGPATYSRDDLINQDDAWSASVAGAVLMDGAWPALHPQQADLDIRFDLRVSDLLLGTEIGDVVLVHDSGQLFQCAVIGWNVDITRKALTGTLILSDVSRWTGGLWDTDIWDEGIWSI